MARPELTRAIVAQVYKDGRSSRVGLLRFAFASALTAAMVLALAGFGGLGDIASAAKGTVATIERAVNPPEPSQEKSGVSVRPGAPLNVPGGGGSNSDVGLSSSASANQYGENVIICHRPPGNPDNAQTLIIDESAVAAHLANGDTIGACP
jgi:hypothetical protein